MSDRILVYHEGTINGIVDRSEILANNITQKEMLEMAFAQNRYGGDRRMSESTKKKFYQTDGFRMFMGKYGIGVILIFMILVIGVMKPRFLYPSNILNVLTQISVNCLIAYGMCLCITTGGIDLSVGPQLHWYLYYWDSLS